MRTSFLRLLHTRTPLRQGNLPGGAETPGSRFLNSMLRQLHKTEPSTSGRQFRRRRRPHICGNAECETAEHPIGNWVIAHCPRIHRGPREVSDIAERARTRRSTAAARPFLLYRVLKGRGWQLPINLGAKEKDRGLLIIASV